MKDATAKDKCDYIKANMICGFLAMSLMQLEVAKESFKQVEVDEDFSYYYDLTDPQELSTVVVLCLLAC